MYKYRILLGLSILKYFPIEVIKNQHKFSDQLNNLPPEYNMLYYMTKLLKNDTYSKCSFGLFGFGNRSAYCLGCFHHLCTRKDDLGLLCNFCGLNAKVIEQATTDHEQR